MNKTEAAFAPPPLKSGMKRQITGVAVAVAAVSIVIGAALLFPAVATGQDLTYTGTVSLSASGNNGDRDPDTAGLQVHEGDTVIFTVTASSAIPSGSMGGVRFDISGSASETDDYTEVRSTDGDEIAGNLNIRGGQTTASKRYPIVDDLVAEGDETLIATISNPSTLGLPLGASFTLGSTTSVSVTIVGDAGGSEAYIPDANTQTEAAEGETLQVPVSIRGQARSFSSGVNFTIGGTATTTDYEVVTQATPSGNQITFNSATGAGQIQFFGNQTSRNLPIRILDDGDFDPGETLIITLTGHSGGSGPEHVVDADADARTYTLSEAGVVLSPTALSVDEGMSEVYTVALASRLNADVTVSVAQSVSPGGHDLRLTPPGELTFTADNWNIARTVTVAAGEDGDSRDDSARIRFAIERMVVGEIAVAVADNDADVMPAFEVTVDAQTYADGARIMPLTLPTASGGNGRLAYSLRPLPSGLGFNRSNRVLSGSPSGVSAPVALTYTATDEDGDPTRLTFSVSVLATTRTISIAGTTGVTETDDSTATATYTITADRAFSGDTTVFWAVDPVTITYRHGSGRFRYSVTNAPSAADFNALGGSVVFTAGDTAQTFTLGIVADDISEPAERFRVRVSLANPLVDGGTAYGGPAQTTITDDDGQTFTLGEEPPTTADPNITPFGVFSESHFLGREKTYFVEVAGEPVVSNFPDVDFLRVEHIDTEDADINPNDLVQRGFLGPHITHGRRLFFPFNIENDDLNEAAERFRLVVPPISIPNHHAGPPLIATILDDDPITATFTVDAAATTVTEGEDASVSIALSGGVPTADVVIDWEVSGAVESRGEHTLALADITGANATATYALTFSTPDNALNEAERAFTFTATAGRSAGVVTLADPAHTFALADNDPMSVTLSSGGSAREGEAATVDVALGGATPSADVVLSYRVTGDAATSGTYTIALGDPPPHAFTFDIPDNNSVDGARTVTVTATATAVGAGEVSVLGVPLLIDVLDDEVVSVVLSGGGEVSEGEAAVVGVALGGVAPSADVVVSYAVSGAIADTGTYTIALADAGDAHSFTITTPENGVNEGARAFTVTVTADSGGALEVSGSPQIFTVLDDDPITATLGGGGEVSEGDAAVVTVDLSGGARSADVVIRYSVAGALTQSGAYTIALDASPTYSFSLPTPENSVNERARTFTVTADASSAGAVDIAASPQVFTLLDDDAITVSISADAASVAEDGEAGFSIALSAPSPTAVRLPFSVSGLDPGEYRITAPPGLAASATAGVVTVDAGETAAVITLALMDDDLNEPSETLRLTAGAVAGAPGVIGYAPGGDGASVTVTDTDPLTLSVDAAATTATENGDAVFTIRLSNPSAATVSAAWHVTGLADPNVIDPSSGTVTFAPGDTRRAVTIAIGHAEMMGAMSERETLTFTLGALRGGHGALAQGDTAPPVAVRFVSSHEFALRGASALAEGAAGTYTVTRSGVDIAVGNRIVIRWVYAAAGDGAPEPADFAGGALPRGGELVFREGEREKTFRVAVGDDAHSEGAETFTLSITTDDATLNSHGGLSLGEALTVSIGESDRPVSLGVTAPAGGLREGVAADFTVGFSEAVATTEPVTFAWALTHRATEEADFAATAGAAVIPAGMRSVAVAVTALADGINEPAEAFTFAVSAPRGGGAIAAPRLGADAVAESAIGVSGFGGASVAEQFYTAGFAITPLTLPVAALSGGAPSYALLPAARIPAGLVFAPATRVLSGAPDAPAAAVMLTHTARTAGGGIGASLAFRVQVAHPVAIAPAALSIDSGMRAVYGVRLTAPPDGEVRVTPRVVGGDGSAAVELATADASGVLRFTRADWSRAQSVTITAGERTGEARIAHAVAGAGNYTAAGEVAVTVTPGGVVLDTLNRVILPEVARALADQQSGAIARRVAAVRAGDTLSSGHASLGGQSTLAAVAASQMKSLADGGVNLKGLLGGSGFALPLGDGGGDGGGSRVGLWGGGDYRKLGGESETSGATEWDGDLLSANLGIDARLSPGLLAGVMLSWSEADIGNYETVVAGEIRRGEYRLEMSGAHPYLGWRAGRLEGWAMAGYASGELEITPAGAREPSRSDVNIRSVGIGGGGLLVGGGSDNGGELWLKGEALVTRAEVEGGEARAGAARIRALSVGANRVRLALESRRSRSRENGALLASTVEVGLRYDGGDGKTGGGAEAGGTLRYRRAGVSLETRARALLAHSGDSEDWGVGAALRIEPGLDAQGVSFSLAPAYGNPASATDTLWRRGLPSDAADSADTDLAMRLNARLGYGLPGGALTPYGEMTLGEGRRDYRLGLRWQWGAPPVVRLDLAGERRVRTDADGDRGMGFVLRGEMRF